MKLLLKKNIGKELTITIEYPKCDEQVTRIINAIKAEEASVLGEENGRSYKVNIPDIYYIESIDKHTFIYTKNNIYRSTQRLLQLEAELRKYAFIRVNKKCILNINVLVCLKTLVNSKLEANLINGEKIIISRTYIPDIKKAVFKEDV